MKTPELSGYGVRLLPLEMRHVEALLGAQDASTWSFMSEDAGSAERMRQFVASAVAGMTAGSVQAWATTVETADGWKVVGSSRLADLEMHHRRAELGWTFVAPWLAGKGLNPRVKLLQLGHAFETLGLRRVALKTHHANLRSQAAIRKLGAQYEGTFRQHMFLPDGSSRNTVWFSVLDSEWPAVKSGLLRRVEGEALSL